MLLTIIAATNFDTQIVKCSNFAVMLSIIANRLLLKFRMIAG